MNLTDNQTAGGLTPFQALALLMFRGSIRCPNFGRDIVSPKYLFLLKVTMSLDNISVIAQLCSSVATFAVAILLLRSLRLQHKDSVTSLGVGMTDSLTELLSIMIRDAEFSDLFLRGVESDGTLNKIETHRYNVFMNVYFLQIQEIWEYDSTSTQSRLLAMAMMQTGPGVYMWFKQVGPILFKPEFVEYVENEIVAAIK